MKELKKLYWWWVSLPFDKKAHISAGKDSAWIALTFILMLSMINQWFYAIPVVLMSALVGLAKEGYDKFFKKEEFDLEDVKFTIYGGAVITVYQLFFTLLFQVCKVYFFK